MRRRAGTLLLVAAALMARGALAQAPSVTEARPSEATLPLADTLYQRAKDLMAAGRYAEACEDFAESNRIDQATGGTLLNLAVCHEKLGRVATAAAEFEQARALARYYKRPDREQFAAQHLAVLRARISTVSFSLHDASDGERVLLDGVVVAKVAWSNLPLDPGDHSVVANGPGKVPWSTTLSISADHESRVLEVPALADAPAPPAPPPLASSPALPLDSRPQTPRQRIVAFALGGVGLATIGVGAAFGVGAIEQNSTSKQNCPNGRCNATGAANSRYALTDANVANVCIGAGIVAVGVATVLVLTTGSRGSSSKAARAVATLAAAAVSTGALGLGGAW